MILAGKLSYPFPEEAPSTLQSIKFDKLMDVSEVDKIGSSLLAEMAKTSVSGVSVFKAREIAQTSAPKMEEKKKEKKYP